MIEDAVRKTVEPEKAIARPRRRATRGNAAERRRRAQERAAQAIKRILKQSSPDEAEAFASHIEQAARIDSSDGPGSSFARELGGREYTAQERVGLEARMAVCAFERRQELLAGALTGSQVAKLLHTTRQTPYDRVKSGSLLAVYDRGAWRFPAWQLDPEGPDGVVPGLPAVLRALEVGEIAKTSWLSTPNAVLEGRTPIQALKQGEVDRVLDLARGVGAM
jgi:hypothetical protein